MYIPRQIEPGVQKNLFKGDIVIIYGARQVGKTTLVENIIKANSSLNPKYLNCDEGDIHRILSEADTSTALKNIFGNSKLIIIDEAQRIKNIGLKLKLLVDNFPKTQIIATGSSSFDLANEVKEPLTGRSREFWLYQLNSKEMFGNNNLEFNREIENLLVYGSYPAVFAADSHEEKKINLNKIASNYLYKDILKFQNLKDSEIARKLLEALALQLGNEVSYNELANLVGISKQTVESYIEIFEKAFITFKITPYSKNLRKELGKLRKIYFYDLGIRNFLIDSLKPLSLRNDIGPLWENFVVAEKKKESNFIGNINKLYFWRTYDGQEIDLLVEKDGNIEGFEIKWSKNKFKIPKTFSDNYPNIKVILVNKDNYSF